ncbi:MAG: tetratricopeptide repeat protein [Actinobacteria bacterium]|nr:tetratricopeptide repeat protein [Actinomycetota bacterium]
MSSETSFNENTTSKRSISYYFYVFLLTFLFFPWGFITPIFVGGGAFFEYRALSYVLLLLTLIVFLLEYTEFKAKRTGIYLPVIFISIGIVLSFLKHANVSATSEFAVYLCSIVGLGFLSNFFSYDEERRRSIIKLIIFLLSLLGLYGLYQYFLVYPNLKGSSEGFLKIFDFRLTSIFTSPAAFAAVVILIWPVIFYFLIEEKQVVRKTLYILSLIILLSALVFTYSKSALAAIFLQGVLISLFLARKKKGRIALNLSLLVIIVIVIFLLTVIFSSLRSGSVPSSFANLKGSFEGRISLWITALKMFIDNPISGVGAGAFKDLFYKYQYDGFFSINSHSTFIQAFSETGIFGGIGILLLAIYLILKCCVFNKEFRLSKFIGFGIVGFLFMNLFDSLLYYHLLGYLFGSIIGVAYSEIDKPLVSHRDFPRNAFLAFFAFFLFLSVVVNIGHYLYIGGQNLVINNFNDGVRLIKLATILNPIEAEYHRGLAQAYSGGVFSNKAYRYMRITELKRAIFLQPYNPKYYFELGYFYEIEGQPELASYFYKKAIEMAPKQPFYYFQLGRLYYDNLKPDTAKKYLKLCLSLEYYYKKKYVLQSYRASVQVSEYDPYLSMARAALLLGNSSLSNQDYKEAIAYYGKAILLFPSLSDAYAARASAYIRIGNFKEAIKDAEKAIEIDSQNAYYYYITAVAYYSIRSYENALLYLGQALKLDPNNEEYLKFYENLKKVYKK